MIFRRRASIYQQSRIKPASKYEEFITGLYMGSIWGIRSNDGSIWAPNKQNEKACYLVVPDRGRIHHNLPITFGLRSWNGSDWTFMGVCETLGGTFCCIRCIETWDWEKGCPCSFIVLGTWMFWFEFPIWSTFNLLPVTNSKTQSYTTKSSLYKIISMIPIDAWEKLLVIAELGCIGFEKLAYFCSNGGIGTFWWSNVLSDCFCRNEEYLFGFWGWQ